MFKKSEIIAIVFALIALNGAMAQRPSYAGSRPTGGLNQKDKYHATNSNGSGIANRFGAPDPQVNTIPYGMPQRPPMGSEVITPQNSYVPLPPPAARPNITFDDRFGGGDSTATANASAGAAGGAAGSGAAAAPLPLPFDAHGDRELVAQLSRLPVDKRPFWFVNYQAIEAHRNGTGNNFAGAIESRGSFFG